MQVKYKLTVFLCCLFTAFQTNANGKEPVDYVDCFIGTSNSRWMLGPYAQMPFGMVQIGPITKVIAGWADTNMPLTVFRHSATFMPGQWAACR